MKKRATSRWLALALALVLAFSLNTTAFAAVRNLPGGIVIGPDPNNGVGGLGPATVEPNGPYTVKIHPNKFISTPDGGANDTALRGRFKAYQIFDAVVNKSSSSAYYPDSTGGYEEIGPGEIGGITWGNSIKKGTASGTNGEYSGYADLLVALMNNDTSLAKAGISSGTLSAPYTGCTTLGQLFMAALIDAGYAVTDASGPVTSATDGTEITGITKGDTLDTDLSKSAAIIAKVLDDFTPDTGNNAALAEAFAKALAAKTDAGYTYLQAPEDSTWKGDHWEIEVDGGYYLIVDEYSGTEGTDKAFSDFLVGVFGDADVYTKTDAPDVDKDIINGDNSDETTKGSDFEIGDTIVFELEGDLAANYDNYILYYYAFHDTLSKGLTYVPGSVNVYVTVKNTLYGTAGHENDPETFTIDITALMQDETAYAKGTNQDKDVFYVSHSDGDEGKTKLDIVFPDLKKLGITDTTKITDLVAQIAAQLPDDLKGNANAIASALTFYSGSKITVHYSAILNDDAVINDLEGNPNEVYLEYSNDPDSDDENDTGTTTVKKVYVYDFGFQIHKIDGTTGKDLGGAGFALTKTTTNEKQYALVGPGGELAYVTESELKNTYGISEDDLTKATYSGGELGTYGKTPNPTYTGTAKSLSELSTTKSEEDMAELPYGDFHLLLSEGATTGQYQPVSLKANTTYYAIMKKTATGTGTGDTGTPDVYHLAGWISKDELDKVFNTHTHDDEEDKTFVGSLKTKDTAGENDYYLMADGLYKMGAGGTGTQVTATKTTAEAGEYYVDDGKIYQKAADGTDKDKFICIAALDGVLSKDEWGAVVDTTGKITDTGLADLVKQLKDGVCILGGTYTSGGDYYLVAVTPTNGRVRFEGLEEGEYTLTEAFPPEGYVPIDGPITVKYEAEYYTAADEEEDPTHKEGMLKTLTMKVKQGDAAEVTYEIVKDGAYGNYPGANGAAFVDLTAAFDVENYDKYHVPGTGGMGTTLFYVGGGVLLAGAAVLLVVVNRKKPAGKRAK